jgi:hypothetical protein
MASQQALLSERFDRVFALDARTMIGHLFILSYMRVFNYCRSNFRREKRSDENQPECGPEQTRATQHDDCADEPKIVPKFGSGAIKPR